MLQSFGLTTNCIQIHNICLFWQTFIGLLNVCIATSLFPSNNSRSDNSNVFKFYHPRYLVMMLSYDLESSTISQKVFSVNLFLLLHFRSWYISTISCSILRVKPRLVPSPLLVPILVSWPYWVGRVLSALQVGYPLIKTSVYSFSSRLMCLSTFYLFLTLELPLVRWALSYISLKLSEFFIMQDIIHVLFLCLVPLNVGGAYLFPLLPYSPESMSSHIK